MKKLSVLLLFILSVSSVAQDQDQYQACRDLLGELSNQTFIRQEIEAIEDLEKTAEDLRKKNGQFKRRSMIERDRKMKFLELSLKNGDVSQLVSQFREEFRSVELAYYTIIHHEKVLHEMSHKNSGELDSTTNKRWLDQVAIMEVELDSAYKKLGENYVDYLVARETLEAELKSGDEKRIFIATMALGQLGHQDMSKRFPELGIDPSVRPAMGAIAEIFKTSPKAIIALLKNDIRDERQVQRAKWSYWTVSSFQKGLMAAGRLKVGPWQIGGPKVQQFLSLFFLLSRDKYLISEHLHRVEAVLQLSTVEEQAQILVDMCDGRCDELTETFARIGFLSDEWITLKKYIDGKVEHPQYKHLSGLMASAEKIAEKSGGLSPNYHDLRSSRAQFVLSTAATAFWTFVLTNSSADMLAYWGQLKQFVLNIF